MILLTNSKEIDFHFSQELILLLRLLVNHMEILGEGIVPLKKWLRDKLKKNYVLFLSSGLVSLLNVILLI